MSSLAYYRSRARLFQRYERNLISSIDTTTDFRKQRNLAISQAILHHPQPLSVSQQARAYVLASHPLGIFLSPTECAHLAIARILEGR